MSQSNDSKIPLLIKDAITETLKIQISLNVKVEVNMVSDGTKNNGSTIDLVSIMGIKSSTLTGSIAIALPKNTFLGILESMLGEKHTEVSNENADAASEMLNIIYASARVKINESGFDFAPAIPSTICGHDIWLPKGHFSNFVKFDCSCEKGNFIVALSLKRISPQ